MKPLSIPDRIVFGAISALIGVALGAVAALLAAVALDTSPPVRVVLIFSAAYFFCVGAVRGADAGFFVGEAMSALGAIGAAEAGMMPGNALEHDKPSAWRSIWLLGVWLLLVSFITWRW